MKERGANQEKTTILSRERVKIGRCKHKGHTFDFGNLISFSDNCPMHSETNQSLDDVYWTIDPTEDSESFLGC